MAVFDGHCDPQPVDYLETELINKLVNHPLLLSQPFTALTEGTSFLTQSSKKPRDKL